MSEHRRVRREPECAHEWIDRGTPGDEWRECWLCGKQEDHPTPADHCASCPFASCTDCKYQPDHDLTRGNR